MSLLSEAEQMDISASVELLERKGPTLRPPHSSGDNESKRSHLSELRIKHAGRPHQLLHVFAPRLTSILLLGGDKAGDDRCYHKFIPKQIDRMIGISLKLDKNFKEKKVTNNGKVIQGPVEAHAS